MVRRMKFAFVPHDGIYRLYFEPGALLVEEVSEVPETVDWVNVGPGPGPYVFYGHDFSDVVVECLHDCPPQLRQERIEEIKGMP